MLAVTSPTFDTLPPTVDTGSTSVIVCSIVATVFGSLAIIILLRVLGKV